MKTTIKIILIGFVAFLAGLVVRGYLPQKKGEPISPLGNLIEPERPLYKYSIEGLSSTEIPSYTINLDKKIEETDEYTSYLFTMEFDPTLTGDNKKDLKTTTGQINIPNSDPPYPLIVMFRGYADPTIYYTGLGTTPSAKVYAENGYMTVAPDVLGYAGSSENAAGIFESRFQTYTTALVTIESAKGLPHWDRKNLYIWGHSNGGQIALTVLEATSEAYPTVLWAPVSKPFPYSILYYTDESDDEGKLIRSELADFEDLYNTDKFSLTKYLDKIKAPIQLHQGMADDAVPYEWSSELADKLEDLDIELSYFTYPGVDHNMRPDWDSVVARDIEFFEAHQK